MHQDGYDSTSPESVQAARTMSSSRMRGVLRHTWINNGIDQVPNAVPVRWSASIEEANSIRAGFGLSPLNPDHDPAPDLIDSASPVSAIATSIAASSSVQSTPALAERLPKFLQWTSSGRLLVFLLAATSILCLLTNTEGAVTLRTFFFAILAPACLLLTTIAYINRSRGDGQLFRALKVGALAGLVGAAVFFIFRLPFVYSNELGLANYGFRHYPFFNVYPRIGALILGQEVSQPSYGLSTYIIGWGYHLIRATTTGIMIASAIGEMHASLKTGSAHRPASLEAGICGALLAVIIQCCLLLSPYAKLFSIQLTPSFVFTLLLAHISFGISIGLFYSRYSNRTSRAMQPMHA